MNYGRSVLAAALAGQLHALSMTSSPLWIFPALPLLIFALQSAPPRKVVALGALYAVFAGIDVLNAQTYGLFAVSVMVANRILFGMGLGISLSLIARRINGVSVPFVSALALVAWEQIFRIATGTFYVPVSIGNALAGSAFWSQMAAVGGSPLLSFLLSFFGCAFATAFQHRCLAVAGAWLGVASLVPITMALYAGMVFRATDAANVETAESSPFHVRVVQGAVPTWTYESLPFVPAVENEIFSHYASLSRSPTTDANANIDLIVWPESVLRPSARSQAGVYERVRELSQDLDTWFIVGGAYYDSFDQAPINAALSFAPNGTFAFGGKRWLVPLLESEWQADNEPMVFEFEGRRIGVVICVESVYPALFDGFAGQNLDLVLVLANDAGLGAGGREVHARRSSLRAIEMGIPVVHAGQYFETRVFDSRGVEVTRTQKPGAQTIDVVLALP